MPCNTTTLSIFPKSRSPTSPGPYVGTGAISFQVMAGDWRGVVPDLAKVVVQQTGTIRSGRTDRRRASAWAGRCQYAVQSLAEIFFCGCTNSTFDKITAKRQGGVRYQNPGTSQGGAVGPPSTHNPTKEASIAAAGLLLRTAASHQKGVKVNEIYSTLRNSRCSSAIAPPTTVEKFSAG